MRARPVSHSIEILEARIAPAAVVVAYNSATGALDLHASDNDIHSLVVFPTGKNTFRVEGLDTYLNGGVEFMDFTGKLASIDYTGGTGQDRLELKSLPQLKTLDFTGGGSTDTLIASELSVKGAVTFDGSNLQLSGTSTKIGGDLLLTFGHGGYLDSSALKTTIGGRIALTGSDVGNSSIELSGDVMSVGKGISITGGAGNEQLRLDNTTSITIGKNPVTGRAITFLGGGGEDALKGYGPLIKLNGAVEFNGGEDNNIMELGGGTVQIAGDIVVTTGAGADEISFDASHLNVKGAAQFAFGDGVNSLEIRGSAAFSKSLKVSGGSNTDDVGFYASLLTIKSAVEINLGNGGNSFEPQSDTFQAGSLAVTGGTGADEVNIRGLAFKIAGATSFDLGAGDNTFFMGTDSATMAKTVALISGNGADEWSFEIGKGTFGGDFNANLGDGYNRLEIFGGIKFSGGFDYTGGANEDSIYCSESSLTIAKTMAVTLGDGMNSVFFSSEQTSLLKGASIIGGADDDAVRLDGTKFTSGGLFIFSGGEGDDQFFAQVPALTMKAGLTFNGGDGADTFTLQASGTLTGNVLVDLGASDLGDQAATFMAKSGLPGSLKITGTLTVQAATTDTGSVGFTESIALTDLSVTKGIGILLGDGSVHSQVSIENGSTSGGLTLNTGGGDDFVIIDVLDTFGPMSIAKITSIDMGSGDDSIRIGGSSAVGSNNLVRFLGNVTVDGGTGVNTNLNDIFNPLTNFFAPGITKSLLGFVE